MDQISDYFRWLYDAHGINLTIFYDALDRQQFINGIWTTIHLALVCVILSVCIGAVGVWLQGFRSAAVRWLIAGYINFFRNTPPLVQLYFFFFALDPAISGALGHTGGLLSGYGWAVIALSLYAGAFNVEVFRSGIEAVPHSTREAADALGYTNLQIFRHVTFPLALRISLPALGSNLVNLIKTTTIAYAISVAETLYVANQIWSQSSNVIEMMNIVWIFYLVLVGIFMALMSRWERSLRVPGFGRNS